MARPRIDIDEEQLEKLAIMQCADREIAAWFSVSVDTLHRRYADLIRKARDKGRTELRRVMWKKAVIENNTTMQIFLSKQWLGYSDKVDIEKFAFDPFIISMPLKQRQIVIGEKNQVKEIAKGSGAVEVLSVDEVKDVTKAMKD